MGISGGFEYGYRDRYTARLKVNGLTFTGDGNTSIMARKNACKRAIRFYPNLGSIYDHLWYSSTASPIECHHAS